MTTNATCQDFEKIDMRIGRISKAEVFSKSKKPAYKLEVDLGPELGTKRSSAPDNESLQTGRPSAKAGSMRD